MIKAGKAAASRDTKESAENASDAQLPRLVAHSTAARPVLAVTFVEQHSNRDYGNTSIHGRRWRVMEVSHWLKGPVSSSSGRSLVRLGMCSLFEMRPVTASHRTFFVHIFSDAFAYHRKNHYCKNGRAQWATCYRTWNFEVPWYFNFKDKVSIPQPQRALEDRFWDQVWTYCQFWLFNIKAKNWKDSPPHKVQFTFWKRHFSGHVLKMVGCKWLPRID